MLLVDEGLLDINRCSSAQFLRSRPAMMTVYKVHSAIHENTNPAIIVAGD